MRRHVWPPRRLGPRNVSYAPQSGVPRVAAASRPGLEPVVLFNACTVALLNDTELRRRLAGRISGPHVDLAVQVNRLCRERGVEIDPARPESVDEEDVDYLCNLLNKTREAVLRALAHVIAAMRAK